MRGNRRTRECLASLWSECNVMITGHIALINTLVISLQTSIRLYNQLTKIREPLESTSILPHMFKLFLHRSLSIHCSATPLIHALYITDPPPLRVRSCSEWHETVQRGFKSSESKMYTSVGFRALSAQ